MERPNAWKEYKKAELKKVEQTAEAYRRFLDNGKTERECAAQAVEMLEKAGYISLDSAIAAGKKLRRWVWLKTPEPEHTRKILAFDADNNAGRIDVETWWQFLRKLAANGYIKMEELS